MAKEKAEPKPVKKKAKTNRKKKTVVNNSEPKQTRKNSAKKIWHIFRFTPRYEIAEKRDCWRKGPLLYTKQHVGSGNDAESIAVQKQLGEVKLHKDRHLLKSCYFELTEISANQPLCYRGFLIDGKFEPASTATIGLWLGLDKKTTDHVLKELSKTGLIERIDIPEFDPDTPWPTTEGPPPLPENESPPEDDKNKGEGKNPGKSRKSRSGPENSGSKGKQSKGKSKSGIEDPLKEKKTNSGSGKDNRKVNKTPKAQPGSSQTKAAGEDVLFVPVSQAE